MVSGVTSRNPPVGKQDRKEKQVSYFKTCPHCGANLDPGETCTDCRNREDAARGATNTTDGKAEKVLEDSDSASTINQNGGLVK